MEKRKSNLSSLKSCRFCLTQDSTLSSLYDKNRIPKNAIPLPLQIMACVSVEVFPSDRMLAYICERCRYFMDLFYRFKQICRQADENILQYLQNEEALEPIVWPAKLTKIFRVASLPLKKQKTSSVSVDNESSDAAPPTASNDEQGSEDDEYGNVFNIKIGDGPDDDAKESTCIKVVKTGDKLHITKDDTKPKSKKGIAAHSQVVRHVRGNADDRPYPCKYCNKSFAKSHHYTRHMRVIHKDVVLSPGSPFPTATPYLCDQCEKGFLTQDELIYHSAMHATENLTCPLCHEKFEKVEQVSAHIKTHVDGAEFMCELCELVFTTKEKLETHLAVKHEDEVVQEQESEQEDEESMDMEDYEYEDSSINLKDEGDHMVVEIKKPKNFMIPMKKSIPERKTDGTNSEDSDAEASFTELATVETIAVAKQTAKQPDKNLATITKLNEKKSSENKTNQNQPSASILRKTEEIKRKSMQKTAESKVVQKPEKAASKSETITTAGANDKSLRLLEKELQELKRTKTTNISEANKIVAKSSEVLKNRRPVLHTSTPKHKSGEEKKLVANTKTPPVDRKMQERQDRRVVTKENKEPKEKEARNNNNTSNKEDSVKVTPKAVAKTDSNERASLEENIRRSSRATKIKDYAKMIKDRVSSDDDSDDDDEEYKESEKLQDKGRVKKPNPKLVSKAAAPSEVVEPLPATRKRGRPRKEIQKEVPTKIQKSINGDEDEESEEVNQDKGKNNNKTDKTNDKQDEKDNEKKSLDNSQSPNKSDVNELKKNSIVSPTGQTLFKVPMKSLPPGVKPLPLPAKTAGTLCDMQIGQKVVKVHKIVMSRAEVEAMTRKGLVEMKDGTMVLKPGVKLPTPDSAAIQSATPTGDDGGSESSIIREKAAPTRCSLGEEDV